MIAVAGQGQDRISLPGQSQWRLDEGDMGELGGGVSYIRRLCVRYEDLVRLSSLRCEKCDGFGEYRATAPSGNANNQSRSGFSSIPA